MNNTPASKYNNQESRLSEALRAAIAERSQRRALTIDTARLMYFLQYSDLPIAQNALVVGVGSGLDALACIETGIYKKFTGVDPYNPADGNDDSDYTKLLSLAQNKNYAGLVEIHRSDINRYLQFSSERVFDRIVMNDVLHHIFETKKSLSHTSDFSHAVDLFRRLRSVTVQYGALLISDVQRNGLRQAITQYGLYPSHVNYRTKQSHREWISAATEAGWSLIKTKDYIPYGLSRIIPRQLSRLTRYTMADRYMIILMNKS